jgi:hypothetical protein
MNSSALYRKYIRSHSTGRGTLPKLHAGCASPDNAAVKRISFLLVAILIAAPSLFSREKEFSMPHVARADQLPAHDAHSNDKVTIAAQPYLGHDQAETFGLKYSEHDFVPVLLAVTNDRGESINLSQMDVELITSNRTKLLPATTNDVLRRFSKTYRRGDESNRTTLPIPLPRRGPKVGAGKAAEDEIEAAQFGAKAVEPNATRAGFLFFDVQGVRQPLEGARLYITGVRDDTGQELLYFEIPLDKAITGSTP